MTARTLLEQLAARASHAEPPALDDAASRRLLDMALARAASAPQPPGSSRDTTARPDRERRFAPAWIVAAAAVVCIVAIAWSLLRGHRSASSELARVTLPSGDRLIGEAARFQVASLAPGDRRVRLDDGALVVDAVARGQRFELATPHLVARTTGALFSVDSDAVRSRVQVYRGDLDVEQSGAHHHIAAGTVWDGEVVIAGSHTTLPPALVGIVDELLASGAPPLPTASTASTPTASPDHVPAMQGCVPATGGRDVAGADRRGGDARHAARVGSAPSLDALLERASSELRDKEFDRALATAALAKARGATRGPWRVVTADALRGLRRFDEAATAYQQAASELRGVDADVAGYTAAYLRFHDLRDPAAALVALAAAHVDEPRSPLEERGLALRIRALLALDRRSDARPYAARYLAAYPSSDLRPLVESIVDR